MNEKTENKKVGILINECLFIKTPTLNFKF
jgi:hypothetical protein